MDTSSKLILLSFVGLHDICWTWRLAVQYSTEHHDIMMPDDSLLKSTLFMVICLLGLYSVVVLTVFGAAYSILVLEYHSLFMSNNENSDPGEAVVEDHSLYVL